MYRFYTQANEEYYINYNNSEKSGDSIIVRIEILYFFMAALSPLFG